MIFLDGFKEKKIKKRFICLSVMSGIFAVSTVSASSFKSVNIVDGDKEVATIANRFTSPVEILKEENIQVGEKDCILIEEETDNSLKIRVQRHMPINIRIDDNIFECSVFSGKKVIDVLKENFIYLKDNDKISTSLDQQVYSGMEIKIKRQFKMTVVIDSEIKEFIVPSIAVKEAFLLSGIEIGEFDVCTPSQDFVISSDVTVNVDRVNFVDVYKTEEIPFKTQTVYDSNLQEGDNVIETDGQNGELKIVLKKKMINGDFEDYEEEISREVVKEPVQKVVKIGTKRKIFLEDLKDFAYNRVMKGVVTAYSARAGATTSLGKRTSRGVVAVNPRIIPYGTKMFIPGYGFAVAGDTGGAMLSGRVLVDVYFESEADCRTWGRQVKDVYILD